MSPRNATTSKASGKRFYSWRSQNYWSVTTIMQALPKDALINWAKLYTAEYAVANLSALNQMEANEAVDWVKGASFRFRDKAADIGTYIHSAIEAYSLGKPFPRWPEEGNVRPRLDGFVEFVTKYEPTFLATEASIFNRTETYAGTLDAIVEIAGRRYVLDTKSASGSVYPLTGRRNHGDIYPEVGLQLAAYRHAEFIGLPDGSEAPMPAVDGALALHLTYGDGDTPEWRLLEIDAGDEVFRYFLYLREMFRWKEEISKRVILGEFPATIESGMALQAASSDASASATVT